MIPAHQISKRKKSNSLTAVSLNDTCRSLLSTMVYVIEVLFTKTTRERK